MRSMVISAEIVDAVAQVSLIQEFETASNEFDTDGSVAVYQLPLLEQAAVTKCEARIGTRIVQGKVFERNDARQQFEQAID